MVLVNHANSIDSSTASSFIAVTKQCQWNLGIPKWLDSQGSKLFATGVVSLVTLLEIAVCDYQIVGLRCLVMLKFTMLLLSSCHRHLWRALLTRRKTEAGVLHTQAS